MCVDTGLESRRFCPNGMRGSSETHCTWIGEGLKGSTGLPDSGIKPRFPALQEESLPSEPPGKPTAKEIKAKTSK